MMNGKIWLGGEWRTAAESLAVENPYNGELRCRSRFGSAEGKRTGNSGGVIVNDVLCA